MKKNNEKASSENNYYQVLYQENLAPKSKRLGKIPLSPNGVHKLLITLRGRRDGKRGLPRQDQNNHWQSPYIAGEQNKVETFEANEWAALEIEIAKLQQKSQSITLELEEKKEALAALQKNEPPKPTEQEINAKHSFEEGKNSEIIRRRRQGEWQKQHAGYYNAITTLKNRITELQNKRVDVLTIIEETECITRLICEKKRELHRQYIDAYYHGVLKTNPERDTMPPSLQINDWREYAQQLYVKQHYDKKQREVIEHELA